jgi:PAS domain S-box-containing protein
LHRNASDIVAILDSSGTITYEASSASPILGLHTNDMVGRQLADFVTPDQVADVHGLVSMLLADQGARATLELRMQHADGSWRDMEVFGKNLVHDPAIGGLVINARDISERKRFMAELERLSQTDALTNTLNRRGFLKLAEREFERARRSGHPTTLVMIDIDHFKGVNDSFGHAAGDMVLSTIADGCRSIFAAPTSSLASAAKSSSFFWWIRHWTRRTKSSPAFITGSRATALRPSRETCRSPRASGSRRSTLVW